jgi:hypothetical protein
MKSNKFKYDLGDLVMIGRRMAIVLNRYDRKSKMDLNHPKIKTWFERAYNNDDLKQQYRFYLEGRGKHYFNGITYGIIMIDEIDERDLQDSRRYCWFSPKYLKPLGDE